MEKQDQERLSRYGKLVWDFANGKTTDDILTSFFENLQSVFNFSNDFTEKALTRFPTKKMVIGTLSSKEEKLFQILLKRNEIWEACNMTFASGFCYIMKHDPIDFIFTFSEKRWVGYDYEPINHDEPGYVYETFLIPEKEVKKYISNSKVDDDWKEGLKTRMKTLITICHQIEEIKSEATGRFAEIEEMAEVYPAISDLHNYVKDTQDNLKRIILKIIKADNAYESDGFKSILSRYNSGQKVKYIVDGEHKLVKDKPFIEDNFFDESSLSRVQREQIFNAPISYCFVEYLRNLEYSGKQRIAKCQHCNCIFSKSKLSDRQRYCPVCSKINHTPKEIQSERTQVSRAAKRKRKDREKRKSLYDAQYLRLIQAGYRKKQAEQEAKEYVIEQMPVIE
jgi:hypothetical protein